MTRADRFVEIIGLRSYDGDGSRPDDKLGRYLLVEESRFDNSLYVTSHDALDLAGSYRDCQEEPEDWIVEALYDLDTGDRYYADVTTTFVLRPL